MSTSPTSVYVQLDPPQRSISLRRQLGLPREGSNPPTSLEHPLRFKPQQIHVSSIFQPDLLLVFGPFFSDRQIPCSFLERFLRFLVRTKDTIFVDLQPGFVARRMSSTGLNIGRADGSPGRDGFRLGYSQEPRDDDCCL
jgi:hypothetical protein